MELKNTTLDDVAAVIGFSATLRLAAWFGDRGNVYIPERVTKEQVLARLIGLSASQKLCDEWGGEHLALPRLRAYEEDLRRRIIGRMLEHRFSTREVAMYMRMSERRIQQVARELEVAGLIDVVQPVKEKVEEKPPVKKAGVFDGLMQGKTSGKNR